MLLLGTATAGWPSPAEEENTDLISLDEWLIKDPNSTFMIKMQDDSMEEAGIFKGDLLLLHRGQKPRNFDIVVALVDQDWSIKYYYKKGPQAMLLPANKKYHPIIPHYQLQIEGVVYSVIRKYNST